jgi:peroxiredoxin
MNHVGVSIVALLLLGGCTQTTASKDKAENDESTTAPATAQQPAAQPAVAEAPKPTRDDQVKPATAVAPLPEVTAPSAEPAELPVLLEGKLPLEAPIDSGQQMPPVFFTEQHAQTCRVFVGDPFPALESADVDGQSRNFGDLLGEQLTIVVFWSSKLPTSVEELADLQKRFLGEFGDQGVSVVAVNVGDEPNVAKEFAQHSGATYPQLADPERQAFAQVATEKLPRTYLLDASGKILWFDMEYSRTTRQQLLSAIRYSLAEKP